MKILAFGASYSNHSINKVFAHYVAQQFAEYKLELLDLNVFQLPVFTVDIEKEPTSVEVVNRFIEKLNNADLIIISMAEHNGAYTAAFKNLFDWASRVKAKMFEGKKLFLLSTSDGGRGAIGSLTLAKDRFPRHGAEIVAAFSLPKFYENFNEHNGVTEPLLKEELEAVIKSVKAAIA